ncbi:MAG: ArsC family reductase [Gammaproteobacteria bacterium]|nr:ArsC family reductase [Gammaproteobacteria bacterium]
MTTLYGISNCDTIKKAKCWLDDHNVEYNFHDYKKAGIDKETLQAWCKEFGFESLLNKRGTTWRKLDDTLKDNVDEASAIDIMCEHTSVIKRPVLISGSTRILGFDKNAYQSLL